MNIREPVRTGAHSDPPLGSDHHLQSLWTTAGLVETEHTRPEITDIEAEHQAVIAEPSPLALFGFATGTMCIGLVLAHVWPAGALFALLPPLLWFAGIGQFIGGLFALARGSTFAATAFCSFGMGNIVVATYFWMQHAGVIPMGASSTGMLGIVLFCFAYIALALAVAAVRANAANLITIALLVPGYGLSGYADVATGATAIGTLGGWFLVAAAVAAFYTGAAVVINSQWQREAIPLGSFH